MKKAQTEIASRFDLSQKRVLVLPTLLGKPDSWCFTWSMNRSTAHIIRRERLIALLNRKSSIESSMKKCVERLEKSYVTTAQELLFTVDGRIKELDVLEEAGGD